MTGPEAMAQAIRIWGAARVISVRQRPEGGWYVNTSTNGRDSGRLASDTRGRHYAAHELDVNGQPICHADCADLSRTL